MRGCATGLVLLALAAASAYSIWQVRLLRQDVEELQGRFVRADRADRESMLDHAGAALEALRRGDLRRSLEDLNRLDEMRAEAEAMGAQQRGRLLRLLEAARDAVAKGGARAGELIEDLRRELSRPDRARGPGPPRDPAAEP